MGRRACEPPLGARLRYAFGGRLLGHRDWVRHDLTDAGWRWRAMGRLLVQVAPVAAALTLLPGPAPVHVLLPLFVLVASAFTAASYAEDFRDRRLRQHGLDPPGQGEGSPRLRP